MRVLWDVELDLFPGHFCSFSCRIGVPYKVMCVVKWHRQNKKSCQMEGVSKVPCGGEIRRDPSVGR